MKSVKTENHILLHTQSLCPECLSLVEAYYTEENDMVYLEKSCEEHGEYKTLVWEGVEHWKSWSRPMANHAPDVYDSEIKRGCPYDCGLCPDHRQLTCCVLLEVTSKCNLSCPICFASAEGSSEQEDPDFETIEKWYDMLIRCGGPYNIQLSGGEPTLRDDLPEIIKMGREKGFTFFQLNTNGVRISDDEGYLKALVEAGLSTVFLQFDGFRGTTYKKLRGRNLGEIKRRAIENCAKYHIGVVLVPTVKKGVNDDEIGSIIEFALEHMPYVRGVHFQPISFFGRYDEIENGRITIPAILREIEHQTGKKILAESFSPGNAEHSHCSFHCDFIKEDNGSLRVVKKSSGCCSSGQAMKVVSKKWRAPIKTETASGDFNMKGLDLSSLDEFLLKRQTQSISISGMAFQDVWNIDIERLKRCYIHEVSQEGKLIPFCAYNVTSANGMPLYRNKSGVESSNNEKR
jgi:uncharacterized radical SAM superfamily Fe-S cluster-containing enzyme